MYINFQNGFNGTIDLVLIQKAYPLQLRADVKSQHPLAILFRHDPERKSAPFRFPTLRDDGHLAFRHGSEERSRVNQTGTFARVIMLEHLDRISRWLLVHGEYSGDLNRRDTWFDPGEGLIRISVTDVPLGIGWGSGGTVSRSVKMLLNVPFWRVDQIFPAD